MYINKGTKVVVAACAFLFIVAGVFHFVDLHVEGIPMWLTAISFLCYLTIDILCIFYCRKNIPQPSSRLFVVIGVSLLIFWESVAMLEQVVFPPEYPISRILRYLYYIPMVFVPNCLLFSVLYFNLHPKQRVRGYWYLTFLVSAVLAGLVLTNDRHQMAYIYTEGLDKFYMGHSYGIFYFLLMGWMFIQFIMSFAIMVLRTKKDRDQRFTSAPAFALLIGVMYFAWYVTGKQFGNWFTDFYGVPEIFQGILTTCLGLCVSLGLIRANFNFAEFFEASDISATLVDVNGVTKYKTADIIPVTDEQREEAIRGDIYIDENHRLHSNEINAGHVFWISDMSSLARANRQLMEVKTRLEQDNELLQAENEMIGRKVQADEQNKLYAMMSRAVEPQLKHIENLIQDARPGAKDFKSRLAEACVYNAYVKRYCNLTLLSQESRVLNSTELEYSIRESLTYVELNKVPCRFNAYGNANFNSFVLIFAYRLFEAILEANKGNTRQIMVEMDVTEVNLIKTLDIKISIAAKKGKPVGFDEERLAAYENETRYRGGSVRTVRDGNLLLSHIEIPEIFGEGVYL